MADGNEKERMAKFYFYGRKRFLSQHVSYFYYKALLIGRNSLTCIKRCTCTWGSQVRGMPHTRRSRIASTPPVKELGRSSRTTHPVKEQASGYHTGGCALYAWLGAMKSHLK